MKDLLNNIDVKRVISPVSVSDTTAQVGQIIDRKGFDGLTYLIATGSIADADATFTVLLEESDSSNMASASAVADADLIGTEVLASFQYDDDNETRKLGYIGSKRYRGDFTGTGGELFLLMLQIILVPLTFGLYLFWLITKENRFFIEKTSFQAE